MLQNELNDIVIKYKFFDENDLRFILNKLNKRFEQPNVLFLYDYFGRVQKTIEFEKYTKVIEVEFLSHHAYSYLIDLNQKTKNMYHHYVYIKTFNNSDGVLKTILVFPYPDVMNINERDINAYYL